MDDFSSIIWVVTFGAALLFSAATKKSRKHRSDDNLPHEAWPKEVRPKTLFGVPIEEISTSEADKIAPETAFDVENGHTADYPGHLTRKIAAHQKVANQLETIEKMSFEQADVNEVQEVEAEEKLLSEEFDLRKAVIYSEILKPKFNE